MIINKAPPPNKPPPPPPKSSTQILGGLAHCGNVGPNTNGSNSTNGHTMTNGVSMSSLNSSGRYSHVPSIGSATPALPMNHSQRNGFMRHAEAFSSRSSVSSHNSSLQHHHHINGHSIINNTLGTSECSGSICSHQASLGCPCTNANSVQHIHPNSSSLSDNGSCNLKFNHDNRNLIQPLNGGCNCSLNHVHHSHASTAKCPSQMINSNLRGPNHPPTTTISRHALFCNNDFSNVNAPSLGCHGEMSPRTPCGSNHVHHHHHHHNSHDVQISSSSSLSSLQPVDPTNPSYERCVLQSSTTNPSISNLTSEPLSRPLPPSHLHRLNSCSHHHQPNCCCGQSASMMQRQVCGNHNNFATGHYECNSSSMSADGRNYPHHQTQGIHHHCAPDITTNMSSDISSEPFITPHTYNLSNSSTTTHTSNVAVKHQQQFQGHLLSRGSRSSSSQHYDKYGPSSAASSSSVNANLGAFQMPAGFEDPLPTYPASKLHQPLPPPPTSKSRPQSPCSNRNNAHVNANILMSNIDINLAPNPQQHINNQLPPLPPKPLSPSLNSGPARITNIQTSPRVPDQPVTRLTSQAGVQTPLPISSAPPPLPPLNSRPQSLAHSLMIKTQPSTNEPTNQANPIPNFINLNLNSRNGPPSEAEKKTEALTRQVELEIEEQQKLVEPHGICPKCDNKVMPFQEACKAMNKIYHAACFVCCECGRSMSDKTFYPVGDKIYCKEDFDYIGHMKMVEKCAACKQPILDMILQALDESYHPSCFKCSVCSKCLDGVPFTIDNKNKIYCVEDYHSIHSPKCDACGKTITPINATGETVRVESMDKNYHIECFRCEDCSLPLTDEEPSRSYPLNNHLLCQRCHINRRAKMQAALTMS